MSDLSHDEFQGPDAELMLYAAGELPAGEARRLEQRLAGNAAMRARLEALRGEMAWAAAQLARAEAQSPMSAGMVARARRRGEMAVRAHVGAGAVAGRIGRAEPALADGAVWRVARWPLAAAAALVIGLIVWTYAAGDAGGQRSRQVALGGGQGTTASGADRALNRRGFGVAIEMHRPSPSDEMHVQANVDEPANQADDHLDFLFANPAARSEGDSTPDPLSPGDSFRSDLAALQRLSGDWDEEDADDDGLEAGAGI